MIVILARLLTPDDFGVAAMALVATTIVSLFADPALAVTLIQRPTITERDRSTVFWVTFAVGGLATVVGVAISPLVANFFGEPQVTALFAATSLTFTVVALGATQRALLARKLDFRGLQLREIGSALIGFVAAIALAVGGFGPWAVVGNTIVAAVASTVLLWFLTPWRPHFMFSRQSFRELGSFGGQLFLARMFTWANTNADNLLVGRFLGPAALGFYALAYNVMFLPMTRLAVPLQAVLSPAYSRMQHDVERLEAAWLKSYRIIVGLLAPGFFGIMVVAPDLIPVAFGSKWEEAVHPLQLLCLAGAAHAVVTLDWAILQARGKGGTLLRLYGFVAIVSVASFVIGLQFGIVGVAAAYAIAKWLLFLPDTWITTRGVSFRFWPAVRASAGPLPLALAAAAVSFLLREALVAADVIPFARLLLVGGVMLLVYVGLVLAVAPETVGEARRALRRRSGQGGAETTASS
jgi:O-antigen/teichoic acid export membrane protein